MASAFLPARFNRDDSIKRQKSQSALDILIQMGFPKNRAQKAVAATGDRGVQLASDWLLSHVDDPTLDDGVPREYILYMCPTGKLHNELSTFWEKTITQCSWNGAHSYMPHITLSPFFKVDDSKVSVLSEVFSELEQKTNMAPGKMDFDFFSQMNFIGLFLKDKPYGFLSDVTAEFAKHAKNAGISFEPHKKQLHMTLAYQYPSEQHEKFLKLAKEIDLSADVQWDIRLYSRDPRVGKSEVRKVIKAYTPQVGDELELIDGDYIFMDPREATTSKDGWYHGTSWLTGNNGMFPGVYTQRTAETRTWALHRSLSIRERRKSMVVTNGFTVEEDYDSIVHDDKDYAKVVKHKKIQSVERKEKPPRRLIIVRHGERVDFAMGKKWHELCFDDEGCYTQVNLNLPKVLLKRKTYLEYIKDPPLTNVGKLQAQLTGDHFNDNGLVITAVYCSPAMRCVQTALELYQVLRLKNKLKIEPGLFEWAGHTGVPRWISKEELAKQGFPIDLEYVPQVPAEEIDDEESVSTLYSRSTEATRQILKLYDKTGGNVVFVGHAGTLELCTRELIGKPVRSAMAYREILPKVPYIATCAIEEDLITKRWKFIDPPCVPMSHGRNTVININTLLQN